MDFDVYAGEDSANCSDSYASLIIQECICSVFFLMKILIDLNRKSSKRSNEGGKYLVLHFSYENFGEIKGCRLM